MTVREVLSRVLRDAGAAQVRTELTPSEVVRRARRGRRQTLATRALAASAGTAVVAVAVVIAPAALTRQNTAPPPIHTGQPLTVQEGTSSTPFEGGTAEDTKETAPGQEGPTEPAKTPVDETPPATHTKSAPATSVPRQETSQPTTMVGWGNEPESGSGSATPEAPATLVDIRIGEHPEEGWDRVVFDFADASSLPDYEVRYMQSGEELAEPGSGKPVDIRGVWVMEVTFSETGHEGMRETTLTPSITSVAQVKYVGGFEQVHTAAIGVPWGDDGAGAPPFRVFPDDNSIVVDIAHP